MIVAIYARVSTDEQKDRIEAQLEALRKYCEINQHIVYKEYVDIGVSGMKESRPNFDLLLQDMREGKFQAIVVYKLDRIGRSLKHILNLFAEFDLKKIGFISITQNIDTTSSAGKLQLQIIGAFAEFERNMIADRVRDGMRGKTFRKRGKDKRPRKRGGYFQRWKTRRSFQH